MRNGIEKSVPGGTQKIDGYWATLRRAVGRRSVQTGATADPSKRHRPHQLVRLHQWQYWHLDADRFAVLRGYLTTARMAPVAEFFPFGAIVILNQKNINNT